MLLCHTCCDNASSDAFGSNFWMLLVEGRKHWSFFSARDLPALRPTYPFSFDPVFPPDAAAGCGAEPSEVELAAGELLFVPANCPHEVRNLTATVALSGNYVDESNISACLEALHREALTSARARELRVALAALEEGGGEAQRAAARRRGDRGPSASWRRVKGGEVKDEVQVPGRSVANKKRKITPSAS